MKENTFDIPAYKFGILLNNNQIIPFEDVDGLLPTEINSIVGATSFKFVAYYGTAKREVQSAGKSEFIKTNRMIHLVTVTFQEISLQAKNESIDKLIERKLETLINEEIKKNQERAIKCFFERYQDRDHQATLSRLKKIRTN